MVHGSENQLFDRLQNVGWASYRERTKVKHMLVDHGGAHILVAEKLVDDADVLAPFQQVCREGWRKVWQLAAFGTPAPRTARFTAFCTTLGSRWWRPWAPASLSRQWFSGTNVPPKGT